MKKGCLLLIVMWAALYAGYYFLLQDQFKSPDYKIAAGVLSFFALMGISLLRNAWLAKNDAAAIQASIDGEAPRDDKIIGAAGALVALGEPATSPLTKVPALIYGYEIYRMDRSTSRNSDGTTDSSSTKHLYYSGFRLVPCAIQTRGIRLKLLSFVALDEFANFVGQHQQPIENFNAYRDANQFEDISGMKIKNTLKQFKEMILDDDGDIRKDFLLSADGFTSDTIFREEVVKPGEPICAVGLYSASRGGLVSNYSKGVAVRIFRGDGPTVVGKRRRAMVQLASFGVILLGGMHAGLWFVVQRFGMNPGALKLPF